MANISEFIAKGQNVVGTVNAVRDFLPESVRNNLDTFLNGSRPQGSDRKGLNKIRSTIDGVNGLQRNSQFYVTIPAPVCMTGDQTPTLLPFLTESAALPGVMLATTSVKRYGIGVEEKKPYLPTFVDVNMTFFGDGSGYVHQFFGNWINNIVIYDRRATLPNAFEVRYKYDYAVDITITTLDETGQKVIEVVLMGAYPIFLGDVSLSWADTDSFAKIPVGFTYTNWKKNIVDINQPIAQGGGVGALQRIMGIASAVQVLSTIRKPRGIADTINVINNSKLAVGGLLRGFL